MKCPPIFPATSGCASGEPLYRPAGCRECRHTGYSRSRRTVRIAGRQRRDSPPGQRADQLATLKQAAREAGMQTLRQNGWRKVLAGQTSMAEVVRVAKAD